jgi:superfamily I DNA/RNA helicase
MELHPEVAARLARLAPDQRAAATAPPGPVLCIAPAGSGKTTTLVARVAWLVATGVDPATVTAIAFNRRAAEELTERLHEALAPLEVAGGREARVRTFHGLGREMLLEAGQPVEPLLDRDTVVRRILPGAAGAERRRLDAAFSRLKLDLAVDPAIVAADPSAGRTARAWVAYEAALAEAGGLDFDDLVARALRLVETDAAILDRWRRAAAHLVVDEAQDLDRSQLRLALLLAAPANRIFLVGDDDQSIYGWRLADVRRVLSLAASLPGLRRVDLEVNYRCPAPVVDRSVRLVAVNTERFAKRVRAGPAASGRLVLAPDPADDASRLRRVLATWPPDGTHAVLARTNRDLLPAASVCLERGLPFRAPRVPWPLESSFLDDLLERAATTSAAWPLLVRLEAVRLEAIRLDGAAAPVASPDDDHAPEPDPLAAADVEPPTFSRTDVAAALLAWAAPFADLAGFASAVRERRDRLADLRREDASLTLATAHATKGLEFDHVAVLTDGFPARRAVADSVQPLRVLEEERRLAYVAWTRARRSLTLVYDPAAPSPFLLEAFSPSELGTEATVGA